MMAATGVIRACLAACLLVGSVQCTCPVVRLCIVDASLSHYVGN